MRFRSTTLLLEEFDEVIVIGSRGDAFILRDRGYSADFIVEKIKAQQLLPDEILKQMEERKAQAKKDGLGKSET